jgi:hypothetical protein
VDGRQRGRGVTFRQASSAERPCPPRATCIRRRRVCLRAKCIEASAVLRRVPGRSGMVDPRCLGERIQQPVERGRGPSPPPPSQVEADQTGAIYACMPYPGEGRSFPEVSKPVAPVTRPDGHGPGTRLRCAAGRGREGWHQHSGEATRVLRCPKAGAGSVRACRRREHVWEEQGTGKPRRPGQVRLAILVPARRRGSWNAPKRDSKKAAFAQRATPPVAGRGGSWGTTSLEIVGLRPGHHRPLSAALARRMAGKG